MQIQLTQSLAMKQELALAQKIEFANLMTVPDEVLNVVVGAVAYNPKGVETTLQKRKAEKTHVESSEKSQLIYSALTDSTGAGTNNGTIVAPDLRSLDTCLSGFQTAVTPDVTYLARKNDRPEMVFSDHLKGSFGLSMLQLDSSEFPETAKLLAQLRNFDKWKRGELRKAYIEIAGVQREYLENFDEARFNLLDQRQLATNLGLSGGTVSRMLTNRWVEARNLERESKFLYAKDLLVTKDRLKKCVALPQINAMLGKEFGRRDAYTDTEIAAEIPNVARRTITKYRNQMGIPGCKERTLAYQTGKDEPFTIIL